MASFLFVMAIVLGFISMRVTLVGHRGGRPMPKTIIRLLVGTLATFVTWSLFVWGFASLSWYWPLLIFLVAAIISGFSVTHSTWGSLYRTQPAMDGLVTVIGGHLWISNWPF
jgi:cation transport ATPase